MLKMALFECAVNEKCCSVDGGPPPENLPSKANKMLMPGGQPGGGGRAGRRWN